MNWGLLLPSSEALPSSRQRDARDRDRSRNGNREDLLGACDLVGAAQDAMETVEWQRLVMEQEEAMARQQSSEKSPRPRRRSLTPLARRRVPRDGRELGREGRPWSPRSAERNRGDASRHDLRLKSRSRSRMRNRPPTGRRSTFPAEQQLAIVEKSLDRGPPPWRSAGAEADASHEADPPPWRRRKERLDKELRQEREERRDRELQQEEHNRSVPAVASPEAQAPSAPLKPAPQDPPRVFAIGEKVRYWSGTHRKWVEAHVQRVNRDADGELLSYDLTARAQAEIARVKDASTAEDAPAPAARSSTGAGDEITEVPGKPGGQDPSAPEPAKRPTEDLQAVGDGDSHEARFENGEEVQYFSETKERWIDAVVEGHHAKERWASQCERRAL
eukprot:s4291_g1.t1